MLALISPAKKQDFSPGPEALSHNSPLFSQQTTELMKILVKLSEQDLIRLMKISPKLAALNVERYGSFQEEHRLENGKQAALAFLGDTYVGLQAHTLSRDAWQYAEDHLGILSGLYGFLRPLDLIQPHRLEMGTRLENKRGKNLYAFWQEIPTQQINKTIQNHPSPWVINLASNEYFKVVRQEKLQGRLLTPVFKENVGGQLKIVGVKAKRARGMMARFMIDNRLSEPEGLKAFKQNGYQYRPDLSNESEWIFVSE